MLLSDLFGGRRSFNLASAVSKISPVPVAKKATPELERMVPGQLKELEQCYTKNGIIHNSINVLTQIIMSAGYSLKGSKEAVEYFSEFFDNVGYTGGETNWRNILTKTFQYQFIYGFCPWEIIYGTIEKGSLKKSAIVDLDIIDPKRFDYAKDSSDRIALDDYGNPVGYTQSVPSMERVNNKIAPPPQVSLQGNKIFLPPERVAHFKLYEVGDGFYGIGLIEPIYKSYLRQLAVEDGFANASYRVGFPLIDASVGDETHDATPEQITKVAEQLKDINSLTAFSHPSWLKIGLLESRQSAKIRNFLDYWMDVMITGMGIPKAFATGLGETTNRSTLNRQEYIFKIRLKDIIERTVGVLESKVIRRISQVNRVPPVKIQWGEISLEELDSKMERIARCAKHGLITPNPETEDYIREIEGMPKIHGDRE